MIEIHFTVHGKPQPAGSKQSYPYKKKDGKLGVGVTDANPNVKPWQAMVQSAAMDAMEGCEILRGPLSVLFMFFLQRPKSHYGTGRNSGVLKPSAPQYPTTRPDALKLCRGAEDALTQIVYSDDSQIVREEISKDYGQPRVEIRVLCLE